VGRRELVSPRTRRAFREYLVDWPLQAIEDLFENEGLRPGQGSPAVTGQRRSLVERYYAAVDWTSPQDVRKVLRAYEHILADDDLPAPTYGQLKRHLEWDGYRLDATGRLRTPPAAELDALPLAALDDPAAIYDHIDRIGRVMDADPAQAISGARALIEATTKLVLNQLGVAYDEHADVPALVKAAQKALGLHPETLAPTGKGSETVRRLLSNLSQVAIGVAELRNEYGPDHGRTRVAVLSPRHAHLAVGCAGTYCRLLLETLADPDAPWRRAAASP
jgi:Abortive infection C-terminus